MNILVTGAAGFIGAHVVKQLRLANNVACVDRKTGQDIRFLENSLVYPMVIPDVIVHLAAVADIKDNWSTPENRDGVWSHNVDGTMRLLECFPRVPVVFASSASVYGTSLNATEDTLPHVTSPYAASKLSGESLLAAWGERYGVKHHILRLSCVVGEGNTHGHIGDFVRMFQANGCVKARSSGVTKRTHVHVEDVVRAVEMCTSGQVLPGVYNVGSGSWAARDTARVMGLREDEIAWAHDPIGWTGDIAAITSSARLNAQGWRSVRGIESGVREALKGLGWAR